MKILFMFLLIIYTNSQPTASDKANSTTNHETCYSSLIKYQHDNLKYAKNNDDRNKVYREARMKCLETTSKLLEDGEYQTQCCAIPTKAGSDDPQYDVCAGITGGITADSIQEKLTVRDYNRTNIDVKCGLRDGSYMVYTYNQDQNAILETKEFDGKSFVGIKWVFFSLIISLLS